MTVIKSAGKYRLVRRTHHTHLVGDTDLTYRNLVCPSHGTSEVTFRASTDGQYEVELMQTTSVDLRTWDGQTAIKTEKRAFRIGNGEWSMWAAQTTLAFSKSYTKKAWSKGHRMTTIRFSEGVKRRTRKMQFHQMLTLSCTTTDERVFVVAGKLADLTLSVAGAGDIVSREADLSPIQSLLMGTGFNPSESLVVLDIQDRTLQILVTCTDLMRGGKAGATIDLAQSAPTAGLDAPAQEHQKHPQSRIYLLKLINRRSNECRGYLGTRLDSREGMVRNGL
ncbi:hypothetical protein HO173_006198 [Letharia columbiana]|uniref:Uncharacterized protein n=1 Tax=Letharia columbiana TaxID=112416 RepID=A0A8H6FVG9_9LECA|nr:uncharacterized protein HO173_006198 [Letharia columbiana]KAF6235515.1 hypothetical protein HO173_006198 [Letharia columbiana]